ncbi:hypothetical protein BA022_08510 [Diaphorobacter nitroreducens]|nr:hypothetical protein BA022_08510 [Diaphorobacter nitroreducens]
MAPNQILLSNPDPAVGNPVQVNQIVGFDVTRLAETGDDFLDQLRVILGELDRHGGNALAVGTEHAQLLSVRDETAPPAASEEDGRGRSSAATGRDCTVSGRLWPEPPNSTQVRATDRVAIDANMVFSFG